MTSKLHDASLQPTSGHLGLQTRPRRACVRKHHPRQRIWQKSNWLTRTALSSRSVFLSQKWGASRQHLLLESPWSLIWVISHCFLGQWFQSKPSDFFKKSCLELISNFCFWKSSGSPCLLSFTGNQRAWEIAKQTYPRTPGSTKSSQAMSQF